MVGITMLYIALQVVSQGVLGSKLAQATVSPLADVAAASLGGWADIVLLAGASISMFGYLGGMTLSMPRMLFALARDGFLPKALAAVHPVYRSPHVAIPVQSAHHPGRGVDRNVRAAGDSRQRVGARALSGLRTGVVAATAEWACRAAPPTRCFASRSRRMMPWLACGVILWLLTGLTRGEVIGFAACVAIASLPYMFSRRSSESATRSPDRR